MTPTPTTANATGLAAVDSVLPALTTLEGILVSVGLLGVLAVGVWLTTVVRDRVDAGEHKRVLNAVLVLFVVLLGTGVALTLFTVWAAEFAAVSTFSFLNISNPGESVVQAIVTVLLIVGVYVFTGFVKGFIYGVAEDTTPLSKHQTELLFRSTQVSLYTLAVLFVFGIWNINVGGLLVGAGFLGIVLGLAAQQTLSSLIAGFVLMVARPFEIGDWVQIGEREGTVTEISIVNTRIQTFDGEYAMIPNDTVSSSEVINRTRKGRLRIRVEVGVDYDTDLDLATETAMEAMRDVGDILTVPQPQVVLTEFGNSAIVLELRFWIDKPSTRRRWRAQTAVIQSVKAAFDREGIKIPFPQRELLGRIEEGGFRLAESGDGTQLSPEATTGGSGESGSEDETGSTADRGEE